MDEGKYRKAHIQCSIGGMYLQNKGCRILRYTGIPTSTRW